MNKINNEAMKRYVFPQILLFTFASLIAVACQPRPSSAGDHANDKERLQETNPMRTLTAIDQSSVEDQKKRIPDLLDIVAEGEMATRERAKELLRDIAEKSPEAVASKVDERLAEAHRRNAPQEQINLMRLIEQLPRQEEATFPSLVTILNGEDRNMRLWAMYALSGGGTAGEQVVSRLTALAASGEDSMTRYRSINALDDILDGKELAKALKPVLRKGSERDRLMAVEILNRIGSGASPASSELARIVSSEKTSQKLKINVLPALGHARTSHPEALEPLLNLESEVGEDHLSALDRAIKAVKDTNKIPQPAKKEFSFEVLEGRAVDLRLPVTDEDDIQHGIRPEVTNEPARGTFVRTGRATFVYRSAYGHPGTYELEWHATDGLANSDRITTKIDVKPDEQPPGVNTVFSLDRGKIVRIMFGEPVRPDSARKKDNYRIPDVNVTDIELDEEGRAVTLKTGGWDPAETKEINVKGLVDRSKAANEMKETTVAIQRGWMTLDFEAFEHGDTAEDIEGWKEGDESDDSHVDAERFADTDRGNVFSMNASAGGAWQRVLLRKFDPALRGKYRIEFKYWEHGGNTNGKVWLEGADGEPLIGAGTDNPQWEVDVQGKGTVVNDQINRYEHWMHVTMIVDTEENRARVHFNDIEEKDLQKTKGPWDIRDVDGIGGLGAGPSGFWYLDDIEIIRGSAE